MPSSAGGSVMGHAQLCVQSFADRRPDRVVWPGKQWEWTILRPENGTFDAASYVDLYAREKWFYQLYGAKFPKAVKRITDDEAALLAFYDFPAEHRIHLGTTNPIESTFATVRFRTGSTAAPAPAPPPWPWHSSWSSPRKPAGARSTHPTSSPSSAPAPASNGGSSSNAPSSAQPEPFSRSASFASLPVR
jgi:Transposase, Mutator family